MSTSVRTLRGYRFDAKALGLVALFAIVIGGALAVRPMFINAGAEPAFSGSSTGTQAATGATWAIVEAIFAGLLLGGILLWRRFPEWLQDAVSAAAKFAVPVIVGGFGAQVGAFWGVLGLGTGAVFTVKVADYADVWWALNNLLAVGLAIYIAASVGITLGPVILGVGFIGLAIYDYVFADRASWMFQLAGWTVRLGIPVLFIVPHSWRFDWDRLADALEDNSDDDDDESVMQWGIGMADLLLPAAFAVSLAGAGGAPLYGAVAGTLLACVRVSWKMEQGGGAGLPPLVTGALGGWAVAAGAGVMLA